MCENKKMVLYCNYMMKPKEHLTLSFSLTSSLLITTKCKLHDEFDIELIQLLKWNYHTHLTRSNIMGNFIAFPNALVETTRYTIRSVISHPSLTANACYKHISKWKLAFSFSSTGKTNLHTIMLDDTYRISQQYFFYLFVCFPTVCQILSLSVYCCICIFFYRVPQTVRLLLWWWQVVVHWSIAWHCLQNACSTLLGINF